MKQFEFNILLIFLLMLFLTACSGVNQFNAGSSLKVLSSGQTSSPLSQTSPTPIQTSAPSPSRASEVPKVSSQPSENTSSQNPPVTAPSVAATMPLKLSWESTAVKLGEEPQHRNWSEFVYNLVKNDLANQLLPGADDIEQFCPKYNSLSNDLRANFWAALVAGISRYESDDVPTAGSLEKNMGTDPVTEAQVRSEGLLQLSYQDVTGWPFCHFDWEADKSKKPDDPTKSILDPIKNLDCGVRILAQQIQQKHRITLEEGVYWAVLKVNGKFQKIEDIAKMTRAMVPPCN